MGAECYATRENAVNAAPAGDSPRLPLLVASLGCGNPATGGGRGSMSAVQQERDLELARLRAEVERLNEELQRVGRGPQPSASDAVREAWAEAEALVAELADVATEGAGAVPGAGAGLSAREVSEAGRLRLAALREVVQARERKLAELQRQKDELLSIVAHDLRTPLVAIQGFAQLLQASGSRHPLSAKQGEYLERILQGVQTMNRLVDDLLTARSLDQGRLPLRVRPVAVAPFLEEVVRLQRESARQKDVAVELAAADAGEVRFDPDRMGQVLGNLLQNAVKFTPQGGRVTLCASRAGDRLRFEVCDAGPGIHPELLPQLFDRFTQARVAETAGRDYGLGLYICREISSLHGGGVGAENRPEGGSRFWVEIPLHGPGEGA